MEPVRLVIWDLDGIFWHGQLAAGEIAARPGVARLVAELAKRGIASTVCAQNDLIHARAALQALGVWDDFISPSIGPDPKPGRVAALVAALRLPPAAVLYIDPLPANLAAARAALPGLQVAGPELVPHLLRHPLLQGRAGQGLTAREPLPQQPPVTAQARLVDRLILRGPAEMRPLAGELAALAGEVHEEFPLCRLNRTFRIDHCLMLPHVFAPPEGQMRAAMEAVGYQESDWTSALAMPRPGERQVWIFGFWNDDAAQLYKHRQLDLTLPFPAEGEPRAGQDLTRFSPGEMRAVMTHDGNFAAWEALARDFWGVGPLFEYLLHPAIVRMMAAAAARDAMVVILLAPAAASASLLQPSQPVPMNDWLRAAAPEAVFVEMRDFTGPDGTGAAVAQAGRPAYERAAAHIAALIAARFGG